MTPHPHTGKNSPAIFERPITRTLEQLAQDMDGQLRHDDLSRTMYSTDASVYQEKPAAVAFPKNPSDIGKLIRAAGPAGIGLIPRTAGTSLAGQVVGAGIVVDVSRHFTEILEINSHQGWCRVQPGVIRNELNMALRPEGIFFPPETSTASRAMIGGMVGNNSCGANSIVYGTTRDYVLELKGFLSDGSEVTLSAQPPDKFTAELQSADFGPLERQIYQGMYDLLSNPDNQKQIRRNFPKPPVTRRNTGYALDRLLQTSPFGKFSDDFNLCQLVAGSEGTLFFATEIKLRCRPLPPPRNRLLCMHFESLDEALQAVPLIMQHQVYACELIDRFIIEGASRNLQQRRSLQSIEGSPEAILLVEIRGVVDQSLDALADQIVKQVASAGVGYAFPRFSGAEAESIWELRRAGLGVVSNIPGDDKPVAVIEDAAVAVDDLRDFIRQVDQLITDKYQSECVHYGHAGSGELHLRPVINLKTRQGIQKFRDISYDVADIVKRFRGSLSGEHGDGRLRSELLQKMMGDPTYALLRRVKHLWDPANVFNPGKIVDPVSMTRHLRTESSARAHQVATIFSFSQYGGMLRAAEMCNGAGDCRKTHLSGGTMCPSYMATRNESDSTRARANVLRQVLTNSQSQRPLDNQDVKQVMDLCLSCKACKSECPSNVDVAKLKAEFLHGYYDANGVPLDRRLVANMDRFYKLASWAPWLHNFLVGHPRTSALTKRLLGFHAARPLPVLPGRSLRSWFRRHKTHANAGSKGSVMVFCDEFTNYLSPDVGIAAIRFLEKLGYSVELSPNSVSGRAAISVGLLRQAKTVAEKTVAQLAPRVRPGQALIGLEPSALLTLTDEYAELVGPKFRSRAEDLSSRCQLIEEFIFAEKQKGNISAESFVPDQKRVHVHVHCHQKALGSVVPVSQALELPVNYQVKLIPSGCCGMAGSFGYEDHHYDVSMQIGELILLPAVRRAGENDLIAATGISCRQQIQFGANRVSWHPVQILEKALTIR